jgi:hypothetical protein
MWGVDKFRPQEGAIGFRRVGCRRIVGQLWEGAYWQTSQRPEAKRAQRPMMAYNMRGGIKQVFVGVGKRLRADGLWTYMILHMKWPLGANCYTSQALFGT